LWFYFLFDGQFDYFCTHVRPKLPLNAFPSDADDLPPFMKDDVDTISQVHK
jgi:hypothetical protein